MRNQESPEINANSMADIAFLLLIFFLVTTTLQVDLGIIKKIPSNDITDKLDVNQRNVLEVSINSNNDILLESAEKIELKNLKKQVTDFIDNGTNCDYCNGKKDENSSDHPTKAIIVLESSRNTSYGTYVSVHNEINAAYNELRDRLSISLYGITFTELHNSLKKDKGDIILKKKVAHIKDKYPLLLSENDPIKNLNN